MATFNAVQTLADTLVALRAGEKSIAGIFKLSPENLGALADAATAKAASEKGYADVRLLLARMSWHASEAGKRGAAPSHILRSRTSKGATTIYCTEYVYNQNKATKTAAARTSAPVTTGAPAPADTSAETDTSAADAGPDSETIIAALRAELAKVTAERDTAVAELATARAMLASVNDSKRTATKQARKTASA